MSPSWRRCQRWDDENSLQILRKARAVLDLEMLVAATGRERTESQ
jgi:hypothetical protein